ncbi:putative reverse transcriptase domain-containing protein [Tanacetum coccineum]
MPTIGKNPLEFSVGDKVLLKVSPWKGVVSFGKRSNLSPRYVGPFEVVKRVGPVAYRLRLPQELAGIHDTFYVSNLKKFQADVNLHVPLKEIKIDDKLYFVEEPIEIMDREVKKLKRSGGDVNPDSNVITGMFLLNNHYASVLFDSVADRSFVSTTFSTLLDIISDTLDVSYVFELANERFSETNTVLRGCMLGLLDHPFNIDLMPIELGSFDAVIGMDWLAKHHAVIVCNEKIVRIPYGDEGLIVQGDRSGKGKKSKLRIISCTKTQKYIKKACPIFLAHVMRKQTKDKSEEKRLEDVPIVQDFLEVFPEDLLGLPPT